MSEKGAYTEPLPLKREPPSPPDAVGGAGLGGAYDGGRGPRGPPGPSPPRPPPRPPRAAQNGHHGSGSESETGGAADAPLDFSMKSRTKKRELDALSELPPQQQQEPPQQEPVEYSTKRRALSYRPPDHLDPDSRSPEGRPGVNTESPPPVHHQPPPPSQSQSPPREEPGRNGSADDVRTTRLGEPPAALPGALPGAVGAAMPGMGLMPNAFAASLPLYMDPRRMQQQLQQQQQMQQQQQQLQQQVASNGSGKSTARPFKAYPKDALSLPLGYYGIPGMLPFPSIDSVTAQAMGMSSEELFNQYRMYVLKCQQEQARQSAKSGGAQPPVAPAPTPPSQQQQLPAQSPVTHPPVPGSQLSQPPAVQQASPAPPGPPASQASPSAKSTTSETSSTTARSTSSSPTLSTTCTTPTSPGGADPSGAPATPGGGDGTSTTPSRKRGQTMPDERKDEAYWERRRKNNEAAKRSRDSRRAKEDEIAIRAAFLEQENLKLRVEVAALKNETAKLRCMLYNS